MPETILVTGATGTVGSEVVKQLAAKNIQEGRNMSADMFPAIRAGVHTLSKADKIKLKGVEIVQLDYNTPLALKKVFSGISKLFLITPTSDKMVEMTSNAVKAAKEAGVKHIVKLSSIRASTDESNYLGKWHREAEKLIENSGIPYTFLRSTIFMQNFVTKYLDDIKGGFFQLPCGNGKIGFVDVRDIASVAASVLTKPGHENKIYTLTGPEAITFTEVADIFSEKLNKMVTYLDITEEGYENDPQKRKDGAITMLKSKGLPDWLVNSMIEQYRAIKSGKFSTVTNTVQEITGMPPIKFNQFTTDYKQEFAVDPKLKPRAYDLIDRKTEIASEKKSRTGDETRTDYDVTYEHDKLIRKTFKLKIVYNMKGCTGAGHCALSDIYDFQIGEDFKAILVGGKEIAPGVFVKEIETTEPHLAINAAKTCTPRVIAVIDMETGKRIAP